MKTYMDYFSSHLGSLKFSLKSTLLVILFSAVFCELSFSSQVFALFTPTLSASVDNTAALINGNQVINSTSKTTEIPLSLTVNTNNKTGYTAILNSETNETALINNDFTNGVKINSISSAGQLGNFSNNTWGYKFGASTNYAPIPALSSPAQILQTAEKTNGNELNQLSIGMKLSDNLESGRYTNKLVFSILTNNYNRIAIMTEGPDFNEKLKSLETATNKIEHFKKSTVAPTISMNAVNIEDEESECEIKLWLDPTDKTAYYYAETEKVYLNTDSSRMFFSKQKDAKIKNVLDLDLSNFDTSKVTNMQSMFFGIHKLSTLNLSSFDTSNVINMQSMFSGMSNLANLDLSSFNTSNVTDMSRMFYNTFNLANLDLSSFNTSKVMNMETMFRGARNLTNLNLSNFDTSQVRDMNHMFDNMRSLTTLNLSNFDTSKVTNMKAMFYDVPKLTTIDLSSFNTSKVKDMSFMFAGMHSPTTLNLSSFDTSQVTDMSFMFSGMSNITNLNLSGLNTPQVTDMSYMFSGMTNLTTIDLSSFNTSKVKDMQNMFSLQNGDMSKDKLETIYVNNDFDTSELTDDTNMFRNRKRLRGGNGSYLADPSMADKTWLRIDDPTNGRPGYFTRKP